MSLTSSIISPISMKHEVICKWHAALSFTVEVTEGVSHTLHTVFTCSNLTQASEDLYSRATWFAFDSVSLLKVKTTVCQKKARSQSFCLELGVCCAGTISFTRVAPAVCVCTFFITVRRLESGEKKSPTFPCTIINELFVSMKKQNCAEFRDVARFRGI